MDCSPGAVNISIALRDELVKAEKHIQKLESQNAEKDARIQQLEKERDALMRYLINMGCESCLYEECDAYDPPCINCTAERDLWQWKGAQKEN